MSRPDYYPEGDYDTPRAECEAFVRAAIDAGEAYDDIPNLVFRHVRGFGPDLGREVLNEVRGVEEPMEGFM